MNDRAVRVRFAPSPSGHLHVGGARTALFNWLYARHTGGRMVLRIEDTDRQRSTPESIAAILAALRWLGLDWDEGPEVGGPVGPYFQSQRQDIHRRRAAELVAAGKAYRCFCSPAELAEQRRAAQAAGGAAVGYDGRCGRLDADEARRREESGEPCALRFRVPGGTTAWTDVVRGAVEFENRNLDDFIILRSDGHAAYNFAVVVDDAEMLISDVLRGEDHISNTPRQLLLFAALGARPPRYAHLPLILGSDGTRLSKRHGATSVEAFRDQGILPAAMLNHLALLGWSLDDHTTVFTRDELVRQFSLERVTRSAAIFDQQKLEALNAVHLRALPAGERQRLVLDHLQRRGLWRWGEDEARREWLERVVAAAGERLKRPADIEEVAGFLFTEQLEIEPAALRKVLAIDDLDRLLESAAAAVAVVEPYTAAALEPPLRAVAAAHEVGAGKLFTALRVAVTGRLAAPSIFDCLALAGRETVLERLGALRAEVARARRRAASAGTGAGAGERPGA